MNGFVAGMITGIPPLCFALLGPLAPRLAGKRGPELVVVAAMAAVLLGIALRSVAPGTGFFLLCTALALAGIAVGNILMPVLVNDGSPRRWVLPPVPTRPQWPLARQASQASPCR